MRTKIGGNHHEDAFAIEHTARPFSRNLLILSDFGGILTVDAHYRAKGAVVAGIAFENWTDTVPSAEYVAYVDDVAEYVPGSFYKRELPCILALLNLIPVKPECIVIDGFVTLGHAMKPGLGLHLSKALDKKTPIIGVAKSAFSDTPKSSEIYRGKSGKPLYVTVAGIELETAKSAICEMHGENRIPNLIKAADRLCRKAPWKTSGI